MTIAIGTISTRDRVNLRGRGKIIWSACPECGVERWVMYSRYLEVDSKVLCRSCTGKRTVNQNNLHWWNFSNHRKDCKCHRCEMGNQIGINNHSWKGGISIQDGYKLIKIYPDNPLFEMTDSRGYVMEHRYVIAQKLGRVLLREETVHHMDGNKQNNEIDNLELWFTNHGHGVRVKDMLEDWCRLYDYHYPITKNGGEE